MPDIVTVLGGGWSAADVDKTRLPGTVIGVNDSAILAPCNIAITMDRLWFENRLEFLASRGQETYARESAMKSIQTRPDWLHPFGCDYKSTVFSEHETVLNGTNSGFCALNLAYLLRPKTVYLIGFDMNRSPDGRPYWFKPYPWAPGGATKPGKYQEWAGQFEYADQAFKAIGTKVYNVSMTSAIATFEKISARDFERISQ